MASKTSVPAGWPRLRYLITGGGYGKGDEIVAHPDRAKRLVDAGVCEYCEDPGASLFQEGQQGGSEAAGSDAGEAAETEVETKVTRPARNKRKAGG